MCFILFLASSVAAPIIPFGKVGDGKISTEALSDYNAPVRAHFTLPHVIYVGSDVGCGCGFRNTMSTGEGTDEWLASEPDFKGAEKQACHESLVAFLTEQFKGEAAVELYGCWDGDFALAEVERRELPATQLAEPAFHFHHRGFCRVVLA